MVAESQVLTAAEVEARLAALKAEIIRLFKKKGLGYSALLVAGLDFAALFAGGAVAPPKPRPVFGEKE